MTEPSAGQSKASDSKPDTKAEPLPDAKAAPKPEATAAPKPEATAKSPPDLTPQIAKRAYDLYEARGRQEGREVQDWEDAEREIRKDGAKAEHRPELTTEAKPDAKTEPRPEAKTEPQPGPKTRTSSDLTPQLVKRVHELYEELGREDVRAVEDWEKAEREIQHEKSEPESHK